MAWVRLDDSAMDHPKILMLTDAQFRLWVKGLCYCQKHLTDGLIPDQAIKPMLGKANDVKQLCDVGLWHAAEGGFQVHDFLDWNDSKERVTERRAAVGVDKVAHRRRMQDWRDKKKAKRDSACDMSHVVTSDTPQRRHEDASVTRHSDSTVTLLTKPNQTKVQKDPTVSSLSVTGEVTQKALPRMSGTNDTDIAMRAGAFYREWEGLFREYRFGATYLGNAQVDYDKCCLLVEKFTDERLVKLAVVFLNSNEPFIENSTRSLPVFASRISWCDEQLRKAEAKQRRSA